MNGAITVEAVRKTVTVECSIEEAFRIFTADAGSWWPTESHSIHGDKAQQVVFEERKGGEVYEISEGGETGHWATVIAWDPPNRVVLAWEVSPKSLGTEVEVRFTAQERGTRVDLEHRGWERAPEPVERDRYHTGWDYVLGRYQQRI